MLIDRQHLATGLNCDIAEGMGMLDPWEINNFWHDIASIKPARGTISTPCTGLNGSSPLNIRLHPAAWARRLTPARSANSSEEAAVHPRQTRPPIRITSMDVPSSYAMCLASSLLTLRLRMGPSPSELLKWILPHRRSS